VDKGSLSKDMELTMKTAMKLAWMVLVGSLVIMAGCSEVGITGREQLNFVPDSIINSLSLQEYGQFISQNKVSADAQKTGMVRRVGEKIQKAVDAFCRKNATEDPFAGYQWEFNLVEDKAVNAFAMPGGKVVVNTGLLPVAQNETGLAVVMGHEIAHVFARHGAERMSQGLLFEMGGMAVSEALKKKPEETRNLFMTAFGLGTQIGLLLPYSRLHESEADRLGLIFMAMAGYDPQEAIGFWQRMAEESKGQGKPPEILSTHPAGATRIQNIRNLMSEATEFYKPPTGG
jgi:predicted Zn-dependent protease